MVFYMSSQQGWAYFIWRKWWIPHSLWFWGEEIGVKMLPQKEKERWVSRLAIVSFPIPIVTNCTLATQCPDWRPTILWLAILLEIQTLRFSSHLPDPHFKQGIVGLSGAWEILVTQHHLKLEDNTIRMPRFVNQGSKSHSNSGRVVQTSTQTLTLNSLLTEESLLFLWGPSSMQSINTN